MAGPLGERAVVLSPHLDDAVFSLGAAISGAARLGADVRVVTVFANDPDAAGETAEWDVACGFRSAGEAARARRMEDLLACSLVGATPVWLPFRDEDHPPGPDEEAVWDAVAEAAEGAETVLVPGFPLYHPDHRLLTGLVLRRRLPRLRVGLYVEQPYASWRPIGRGRRTWTLPGLTPREGALNAGRILLRTSGGRRLQQPSTAAELVSVLGSPPSWRALRPSLRDWLVKHRAARAYRSQLAGFGPLVLSRVALYEAGWGGEGVAWIR